MRAQEGLEASEGLLRALLLSLRQDGLGWNAQPASASLRADSGGVIWLALRRSWTALRELRRQRTAAQRLVLDRLLRQRDPEGEQGQLCIFLLSDLADALSAGRLELPGLRNPMEAAESVLLELHDARILTLHHGLAIFRAAMKLRRQRRTRGPTREHHEPLERHYRNRRIQVHAALRYAQLGAEDMGKALALVRDWFELPRTDFPRRWFAGQREVVELATHPSSVQAIVGALGHAEQQAIVTSRPDQNLLVLAGPGSGETRVLVHRVAWLVRVQRADPRAVLVVCYTRANAIELRRRLSQLIGEEARQVTIRTLHGVALSLAGHLPEGEDGGDRYTRLIQRATELLHGGAPLPGLDPRDPREDLLGQLRYVLIDEYQDIDADQYALLCALIGKGVGEERRRLSVCAVGDDVYVGMTRARDQLYLLQHPEHPAPGLAALSGLFERSATLAPPPPPYQYEVFGLDRIFLDHAGRKLPDDPIHRRPARLQTGDPLQLHLTEQWALLTTPEGPVASLSREAAQQLRRSPPADLRLRVLAIVERRAEQSAPEYQAMLRSPRWEVPIVEARWRPQPSRSPPLQEPP